MSNRSTYSQSGNRPRQSFASHVPLNTQDHGQSYGSTRDMGPPQLEYLPRPVEIDLNSSRTLPSPSASSTWDSAVYQTSGFGDIPSAYGSSNKLTKNQQLPLDSQVRGAATHPLLDWYGANDGPWIPKGISEVSSEERLHPRWHAGNRAIMPFGAQYRQSSASDNGAFQFGVPHSDSGYGTKQSNDNVSVFSTDVTERTQDCQSLTGHLADYQPFQGINEVLRTHDARATDPWPNPLPSASIPGAPSLYCQTCSKPVKTRSELKKHDLRHKKPFVCKYPGCSRTEGFSTTNDLDRHTKSKHPLPRSEATKKYRCHVLGCKSKDKAWPRLDNFRSHLKRVHQHQLRGDDKFDAFVRRAEFWERPLTPSISKEQKSPHGRSKENRHRSPETVIHDSQVEFHNTESDWNRGFPDVSESPSLDLETNRSPQSQDSNTETTLPQPDTCLSEVQPQDTIGPREVFGPIMKGHNLTRAHEYGNPLENVLNLASTGLHDSRIINASKPGTQGKATRQNDVSAADAAITEVLRTALAGAHIPEHANDTSQLQALDGGGPPDTRRSPGGPWVSQPNPVTSSAGQLNSHNNPADNKSAEGNSGISQEKVLEVLQTLHNLGYNIVQKDPSRLPKIRNTGSAASNKSERKVTCQKCKRFTGRPCELKKHMKRHERPYGCTFLNCNKGFGSKNDWKRHENSQHFHLETWRCDEEKPEGGACAKVYYRRETFKEHLAKDHKISDVDKVKIKVDSCRIGRNCQARFWCGFCKELIDLKKKGLEAWSERFNHIDDHFMGRNSRRLEQRIQDWVPVDSDKPKGKVASPPSLGPSPGEDGQETVSDQSPAGTSSRGSPESTGSPSGSAAQPIIIEGRPSEDHTKRRASDDGTSRPAKHARTSQCVEVIYCCQCGMQHNPRVDELCAVCQDSHRFCASCTREFR